MTFAIDPACMQQVVLYFFIGFVLGIVITIATIASK